VARDGVVCIGFADQVKIQARGVTQYCVVKRAATGIAETIDLIHTSLSEVLAVRQPFFNRFNGFEVKKPLKRRERSSSCCLSPR
jgi:hypothetical protein